MKVLNVDENEVVHCRKPKLMPDASYIFKEKMKEIKSKYPELNIPPLYRFRNSLQSEFEKIPEGSVLTTHRCLCKLFFEKNFTICVYRVDIPVKNATKIFIILQSDNADKYEMSDIFIKKCFLISTLSGNDVNCASGTLQYDSFSLNDSKVEVHFTSNIALFDETGNPVCFRMMPFEQYTNFQHRISRENAFELALKCQLAGIQKIVVPYFQNSKILAISEYTCDQLKSISLPNQNVDDAVEEIKNILRVTIKKFYEKNETRIVLKRDEIEDYRLNIKN